MLDKKGFTLVEIIVIISILSVLFSLTLPLSPRFSSSLYLHASARSLASELRRLQSNSVLRHKTLSFTPAKFMLPPGIKFQRICDIGFSASGFPPPGKSGSLILQDSSGRTKKVVVSSAGRIRLE
jgi:prepilin-type N-terminal cleavage/methylation domain-containing protein